MHPHPTRTSGAVLAEPSLASAATVPLDPADILAAEREANAGPEKETPLSTEALDRPAGVPNRWTGYVFALALIGAVVGTGGYLARSYLGTASALPTATATATITAPPTAATSVAAIIPDPTAAVSATASTNVSSHVGAGGSSHVPSTLASSKDGGARDAAAAPSTSAAAPASAAPSAAPAPDAGAPTSVAGPTVKIGVPHNAQGVDGGKVRVALASNYEQLNACFVKGIKAGDAAAAATMKMHLDFDAELGRHQHGRSADAVLDGAVHRQHRQAHPRGWHRKRRRRLRAGAVVRRLGVLLACCAACSLDEGGGLGSNPDGGTPDVTPT